MVYEATGRIEDETSMRHAEGVRRNFELAQARAAELGPLPEMVSPAAFADFGPDRRAMVCTLCSCSWRVPMCVKQFCA